MKIISTLLFLAALVISARAQAVPETKNLGIAENDVAWTTLGTNENDSMPIGNGDLAANVWTEQNGDLVLLVAKADAWTETGKLVKLGQVRMQWNPNPFVGAGDFTQTLKREAGSIELKRGGNAAGIWIDANLPVLHVETHLEQPGNFQAGLELWRKTQPFNDAAPIEDYSRVMAGDVAPHAEPDTLSPAGAARATSAAPIARAATALMSTTTGCPMNSENFGCSIRASTSDVPPGGNGTTRRTGFAG